jgi:hypothetical protein
VFARQEINKSFIGSQLTGPGRFQNLKTAKALAFELARNANRVRADELIEWTGPCRLVALARHVVKKRSGLLSRPKRTCNEGAPINNPSAQINQLNHSFPLNRGLGNNPTDRDAYIRYNLNR